MPRPIPDPVRPGQTSVWDFPRPAIAEPFAGRVRIELGGCVIAETDAAIRTLETSHPPTYYLPPDSIVPGVLRRVDGGSFCEWKGSAVYWDVVSGTEVRRRAAWSYPDPTPSFALLRDHVAFYAATMDGCYVDGERVMPQPGGFYGGWITADLAGPFKGGPGTMGW